MSDLELSKYRIIQGQWEPKVDLTLKEHKPTGMLLFPPEMSYEEIQRIIGEFEEDSEKAWATYVDTSILTYQAIKPESEATQ